MISAGKHAFARRSMTVAVALVTLVAACATGSVPLGDSGEPATVRVDNRGYVDMTIYTLEGGTIRRRLGVASAVGSATFTIPASLVGQGREVQFLADPIGGARTSVSRRIFVRPGEEVRLMITP